MGCVMTISEMIKIELIYFTFLMSHLVIVTNGSRRIIGGNVVISNRNYVAYLVKAPISRQRYNAWLCGGAIVSPYFIVTSSACVEDVEHMYAIAGMKEYVNADHIKTHKCASQVMKKVIMTCVPKSYELEYDDVQKWTNIDIAAIKVESPFDFDSAPLECDYAPQPIEINYDPKYQKPQIDAQVYGWGHKLQWRSPANTTDMNERYLLYSPLLVQPKSVCYEAYREYNLTKIIDKYMLCLHSSGNIDDHGLLIRKMDPTADGCITEHEKLRGGVGELCGHKFYPETRRDLDEEETFRRNGICQNDHGGPLVTYIGTRQYLIGVASVFKVTSTAMCEGPFLFTSTQCNGAFLDCVINEKARSARSVCNKSPDVRGFEIKRRIISWEDHPDGPAKNERKKKRSKARSKLKPRNGKAKKI